MQKLFLKPSESFFDFRYSGRPAQVYRPNAFFGPTAISEGQLVSNAKAVFQAQRVFLRFAILRVGRPAQVHRLNALFGSTAISEGQHVSNAKAVFQAQRVFFCRSYHCCMKQQTTLAEMNEMKKSAADDRDQRSNRRRAEV